jgi:hypothetical protein
MMRLFNRLPVRQLWTLTLGCSDHWFCALSRRCELHTESGARTDRYAADADFEGSKRRIMMRHRR